MVDEESLCKKMRKIVEENFVSVRPAFHEWKCLHCKQIQKNEDNKRKLEHLVRYTGKNCCNQKFICRALFDEVKSCLMDWERKRVEGLEKKKRNRSVVIELEKSLKKQKPINFKKKIQEDLERKYVQMVVMTNCKSSFLESPYTKSMFSALGFEVPSRKR